MRFLRQAKQIVQRADVIRPLAVIQFKSRSDTPETGKRQDHLSSFQRLETCFAGGEGDLPSMGTQPNHPPQTRTEVASPGKERDCDLRAWLTGENEQRATVGSALALPKRRSMPSWRNCAREWFVFKKRPISARSTGSSDRGCGPSSRNRAEQRCCSRSSSDRCDSGCCETLSTIFFQPHDGGSFIPLFSTNDRGTS